MNIWKLVPALMMAATATVASAHAGHAEQASFLVGALHPLTGLDHLLVMLGIGIWAAQQEKTTAWLMPATFVLVMMIAGTAGYLGVKLPMVEAGISATVMLIGLLIAMAVRLPLWIGMLMTTVFAVFHGHAHGTEYQQASGFWEYGIGFAVVTIVLHLGGYLAGQRFSHNRNAVAAGGMLMATAGIVMLTRTL